MPICRKTCKQTLSNAQPSAESVIWNHQIMTDRKAVIKNADMSEDMQTDAVECATQALEKYNIEKDIAAFIKKRIRQKNTAQPGTALLAATLAVTLPTRPSTLSIFIWDRLLFSCSNLDK